MFRFHILGLLRNREPQHGYALMKEYNRRTGRNYGAGYFYRQLGELLTEGFVRSAPNPLGADPRRTPYQITDRGIESFDHWFEEPSRETQDSSVDPIARAMFFSDVERAVANRVLSEWKEDLLQRAKALQQDLQYAQVRRKEASDMRPMLIHRNLYRLAADLQFLDEISVVLDLEPRAAPTEERARLAPPRTASHKRRKAARSRN
jgi:DNA-binding PadR family transcriptional regulator